MCGFDRSFFDKNCHWPLIALSQRKFPGQLSPLALCQGQDPSIITLILAPAWVRTIACERMPPCSIPRVRLPAGFSRVEGFEEVCRFSLLVSPVFGGYRALAGTPLLVKMFAEQ